MEKEWEGRRGGIRREGSRAKGEEDVHLKQ
jgi:hypothetical protein